MGKRLSGEERKQAILRAAIPLFANNGFNGTTTREIAKAAKVSEALLYKHFPSKEAIYTELETIAVRKQEISARVAALEPSTETMVGVLYFLIATIYKGPPEAFSTPIPHNHLQRLMINSYLEDGAFARIFMERNIKQWQSFFEACIQVAVANEDMIADWLYPQAGWWLSHHVGVACGVLNLPEEQVIQYGFPREELLDQAVRFALRGIGVKDEAIARIYRPDALEQFRLQLLGSMFPTTPPLGE